MNQTVLNPTVEPALTDKYRFWRDHRAVWAAVGLTVALELLTLLLRFGMGLESTRDTASTIGRMTFGLRVHHGYIGLLLWMIYLAISDHAGRETGRHWVRPLARFLAITGFALFFSDMIHHFLVLWPTVGSPQFDLLY